MKPIVWSLFIAVLAAALTACQAAPPVFTADMKPEDYFQHAQERADQGDYQGAIQYYYKCKETFPDNLDKNTWASYEIAFLYHKLGDDAKALVLLDELLALYAQDKGNVLPKAPKTLALRVKDNIVNRDKYSNQTAKPSPSPAAK